MPAPMQSTATDPGGFAVQPDVINAVPPDRIVMIARPDIPGNPWAQPIAYRTPTDQFIGPILEPPFPNNNPNPSRYGPAVVSPASTPQFVRGPVVDPVPTVPAAVI